MKNKLHSVSAEFDELKLTKNDHTLLKCLFAIFKESNKISEIENIFID